MLIFREKAIVLVQCEFTRRSFINSCRNCKFKKENTLQNIFYLNAFSIVGIDYFDAKY